MHPLRPGRSSQLLTVAAVLRPVLGGSVRLRACPGMRRRSLPGAPRRAGAVAVVAAIWSVVVLFAVAMLPMLVGWQPSVVLTGSMAPSLRPGDVVLTAPLGAEPVRAGQLIRFRDPADGSRSLLHRVVAVATDGSVRTRGDANAVDDSSPVALDRVEGEARARIPYLGVPALWLHRLPAGVVSAAVVGALVASLIMARRSRRSAAAADGPGHQPPAVGPRIGAQTVAVAGVLATLGSSSLVWHSSYAAFTGQTGTTSGFAAATVALTDDDGGSGPTTGTAMFTASGVKPTDAPVRRCIQVTYSGSSGVTAPVKLYGTDLVSGGLQTYLNLTVEVGTPGSYASCGTFAGSSIYTGTVGAFAAAYTNYSTGLATTWTPTTNGQTRAFRFTYSVQNNASAQGQSCGLGFVWEAQG